MRASSARPHLRRRNPGFGPQNQQVIEQIGALANEVLSAAAKRRDHRLDRLFAELLRDVRPAARPTALPYRRSRDRRRGARQWCRTAGRARCRRFRPYRPPRCRCRKRRSMPARLASRQGLPLRPHRNPGRRQMGLGLGDAEHAEMEDRGGEHGGGVAIPDPLDQMVERADAARGNDRNRHRIGDGAGQRNVEALPRAVAVHRGEEDLAGAHFGHAPRPGDRIERRCRAARHG